MIAALAMIVSTPDDLIFAIANNINPIHMANDIQLDYTLNVNYTESQIIGNSHTLRIQNEDEPLFMRFESMAKNLVVNFNSNAEYQIVFFATSVYAAAFHDCIFTVAFESAEHNSVVFQDFMNSDISGMHIFADAPNFELFFSASQVVSHALSINTENREVKAQLAYKLVQNCQFTELMLNFQVDGNDNALFAPTLNNVSVHNAIVYVKSSSKVLPIGRNVSLVTITNLFINGSLTDFEENMGVEEINVYNTSGIAQFMQSLSTTDRSFFVFRDSSLKMHHDFTSGASIAIDRNAPFLMYTIPLCPVDEFQFGTTCTEDACDLFGNTCSGEGNCLFFGRYLCQCERGFDGFKACKVCQPSFLEVNGSCFEKVLASDHGVCWKQDDIVLCKCDSGYTDRYCDKKLSWQETISVCLSITFAVCIAVMGWLLYRSATWWRREEHKSDDRIPLEI